MNKQKKLVFMLVVDQDDKFLTYSTLQELQHNVQIRFLSNSAELFIALEAQIPSIILIDYNIAPESGVEILKRLKSNERYGSIPVVILTDSSIWHYHAQCYSYGANSVIKKPETMEMTAHKINTFFDYWVNVAETP